MKEKVKHIFREHTLLVLYFAVFLLLLNGVLIISGTDYLGLMGIYIGSLVLTYLVLYFAGLKNWFVKLFDKRFAKISDRNMEMIMYGLFGYTILTVILHFVYMGGSPAIQAMMFDSSEDIVQLRRSLTRDVPKYINYISAFNIRGFLPFLLFYFLIKEKKVFYLIILLVGCFYSFSLMQKSYVISMLAPVFIYSLLNKKWWYILKYGGLTLLVVFGLMYTSNPDTVEADFGEHIVVEDVEAVDSNDNASTQEENKKGDGVKRIASNLWNRITVVPGEMVSKWFEAIPDQRPYLNGDGYRLIAKLRGHEFRNYSLELYPLFYPTYAERGFQGSVNTASFMYDYANFGKIGLVLSGFLLALLFLIIEALFVGQFLMKFSLNLYSILIISSAALTTTLLSGGWGIMLLLFLFAIKTRSGQNISAEEESSH